jgi:NADH-quinone oxidoreductase subunit N
VTVADLWILIPLFILAAGSLVILLSGAFVPGSYGTLVGLAALVGAACWTLQSPPVPLAPVLGIAATPYARFFTVFFCLTAAIALLLSHTYNERRGIRGEEYPATLLFAAFGMTVVAASANFLTLFLGLEALSFAFYILIAIDRDRPGSVEAGMKYLLMGATAAAFIAFGIALLYAATGSLKIAGALPHLSATDQTLPVALAGWGFLLMGIAFKVSLVPAHLWTPDVYQGAPTPVTAFLSTGSKAAAFAALLLLLLPMGGGVSLLHGPLWCLSLLSMIVGNLAALRQRNLKRMMAYSSIAHMGYVTLALTPGTSEGYAAVIFYLVAYTVTNLSAFGVLAALSGDIPSDGIEELQGLGRRRPFLGGVLALALFSLAGVPPTAGFFGKFTVFASALRGGETTLAVIGILTAAISVYYYLRVIVTLYSAEHEVSPSACRAAFPEVFALSVAGLAVLLIGIMPEHLLRYIKLILL